jgi:hypothetical protein
MKYEKAQNILPYGIIISLLIKLHEKLVDNIRASIGLIIFNIVVAVMLQSFVYCNGILYFFISLIAIAITFMIRYIGIIIKKPQKIELI